MALGTATVANNGNVRFGFGALNELGSGLSELQICRPLICTDTGIVEAGLLDALSEALPPQIELQIFSETPANPTEAAVNAGAALYQESGRDGIIAFGGGSSLDLGKAVALRVTHDGPLADYTTQNGGAGKIGPVVPLIAIPTTAGTGSEVARASVLILENGEKRIIASPQLIPKLALLDPELTLRLPTGLTAATGMDAVTHCIEAVLSPVINPPAEAIGLDGMERAISGKMLIRAVQNGADRDARWNMLMASTEGAMAFSKGLGAVHAMSHACGKDQTLRLHHGTLNAVLLPLVLRHNYGSAIDKYRRLARAMGLQPDADIAEAIERLNGTLGFPANLSEMGITADMISDLAAHAAIDMCTATNPAHLDQTGYERLFEQALAT